MSDLYLEIFKINNSKIEVSLDTLVIYFVYNQCESTVQLNLVIREKCENEVGFIIDTKNITYNLIQKNSLPKLATYCILPNLIINKVAVISGLCSVARQIIKKNTNVETKKLLGFREACLMACNESSIWTKFCEIDMFQSVKNVFRNSSDFFLDNKILLPKDLTRFECHLAQPVKIHNIYKVARDQAKLNNKNIKKDNLTLDHLYSEGPYMTLSDVILYPLVKIFCCIFDENTFKINLPLTYSWLNNLTNQIKTVDFELASLPTLKYISDVEIVQEDIKNQSLYISDPQRYKPKNRIFTKQPDIINALNKINELKLNFQLNESPFGNDIEFDWTKIPLEANPEGGSLPKSRMKRKCHQLENLAKPIIKMALSGHVIVDFCSGSGHLGILLAVKLPKCKIILLENKEISLNRARERIEKLELNNVILLQCNLDYYVGNFDIGVSLHACGVATDLVIQKCLQKNAGFVCCPCCYGGVHVCHHISYPRSQIFKNVLTLDNYLVLGHSADQTHDPKNAKTKQGITCMNIIDTDRKLQAEELGYEVKLAKMIPQTCTPKNNILVGFPKRFY